MCHALAVSFSFFKVTLLKCCFSIPLHVNLCVYKLYSSLSLFIMYSFECVHIEASSGRNVESISTPLLLPLAPAVELSDSQWRPRLARRWFVCVVLVICVSVCISRARSFARLIRVHHKQDNKKTTSQSPLVVACHCYLLSNLS